MTGSRSVCGSMSSIKKPSVTSQSSIPDQPYDGNPISMVAKMPLCPLLVVPAGTRLACIVQNRIWRERQELSFNVRGMQSRGGAALFQLRVSECGNQVPGVYA